MSDHLRFSPSILSRLGEELVPDADQGVIELVKNSYDADATTCRVELAKVQAPGGVVRVVDNGSGMTAEDLRQGFLIIGRSSKDAADLTSHFQRIPVGDKGLGRLSALRLGRKVQVITRPRSEPGIELTLEIDWDEFDEAKAVEDVALEISARPSKGTPGTEIRIEDLRSVFSQGTANKLARNLLLLSDPFRETGPQNVDGDPGFAAILQAPDFEGLQSKVEASYFKDADFHIHAEVDANGDARFALLDWKGDVLHQAVAGRKYATPALKFDVWHFLMEAGRFSTKQSSLPEVRSWLKHIGGVHIYQDGIRVPPYGGPGNDWLDMNLKRARSPEYRPSTNNSIGRVSVSNVTGALIQKTDRIGYVENDAFGELREFCSDALDWAAKVRVSEREAKRKHQRTSLSEQTERAEASLQAVLSKAVPATQRKQVDVAISRVLKASERETKVLREELQLYRSLATAGMTSAVFAHEIGRPLELLDTNLKSLLRLIPEDRRAAAERRVGRIENSSSRLGSFVSIPLKLLAKGKRRQGRVDVNACIQALMELMGPILDYFHIELERELAATHAAINGSEALVDGIVLNFVTNSINAFQRPLSKTDKRKIKISTDYDGDVVLSVEDNAGGIDGVEIEELFLPGVTSSPEGTGFGLTIVQDSVSDLGGRIDVVPLSPYGGAAFTVSLPPMRTLFK